MISLGRIESDNIKRMILLTNDYIKGLLLYQNQFLNNSVVYLDNFLLWVSMFSLNW